MLKQLINLRKELHSKPEVSGDESNTAKRIVEELRKCNPDEIIEEVGGAGVIAKFSSKESSPVKSILFRAELDAISVNEETGLPYKSKKERLMHGCGHDGHMVILIGLAQYLKENRPTDINVYLLFQPAEETGEGAARVLADERFDKINVDHGFALHNLPGQIENSVVVKKGVFAAASTGVEVTFKGRSSHAAYPEEGLNPSVFISEFIQKAEAGFVDFKKADPSNKAVNTYIRLGEPAFGINPGTGQVGYTLRSPSDESLEEAVEVLVQLSEDMKKKFNGSIQIDRVEPFSSTVNSPKGYEAVKKAAEKLGLNVKELGKPFPWSEDFGEFRRKFPIVLFGLGAGVDSTPLHSEKYDFNDNLIEKGIEIFKRIIQDF